MADSATVESIIEYYKNLLIIQYNNLPKASATIDAVIRECVANGVAFDVRDGFSVDTAIGVQLDVIGQYVGVDRFYNLQDITGVHFGYSDQFSFEPVGTTGYADASDFLSKDGDFLSALDVIGTGFALSDTDYRILIKLKILINNSNFSNGSIDENLFAIFGTDIYAFDNLDMSLEYFTTTDFSLIMRVALQKGLLPAPMGVRINNLIEKNVYFGYSDSDSLEQYDVTGYAAASDFASKTGTFMGVVNFIT